LSEKAARLMVAHLGTDLRTHANELEKLATFTAQTKEISEADVEQVVGVSRTHNVFELTKAISMGNKPRATEVVLRMLEHEKHQSQFHFVMITSNHMQLIIALDIIVRTALI